jgi:molybdenum cofactor sulfurtransferase
MEQMTLPTYPPQGLERGLDDFLRRYPSFGSTLELDDLRAREYGRLDRLGHTYLDYTGGGLYAESQLRRHHAFLQERVLGNPHSHSPASLASTAMVDQAREALRRFFNADADEYEVIFTPNATGGLRLVGEAYPFGPGGVYLLSYDNHNSVNGIREFAHHKGAAVVYVPAKKDDLRLDEEHLFSTLGKVRPEGAHLFAYPAQSNFSGVQHPLEWVSRAQDLGWDVVLDCAAYVPTNRLDLARVQPDFVPLSMYKLFGYPTGVGALIARRDKLLKLQRPWFAGGTITVASVQEEGWYKLTPGAAGFEDGTLDYLGLPAVPIGIEHLEAVGIDVIHQRVQALTAWLLDEMGELGHANGAPMVRVFGPRDMQSRGAVIAFHILDPEGHPYDVDAVEAAAGREGISVRTGCFCNPGDGEVAHGISHADMELCFDNSHAVVSLAQCQRVIEDATGKVPNTIRLSLGLASNFADVYRFMEFAAAYRGRKS